MDYHKKYLKYKMKYLKLKQLQTGGRNMLPHEQSRFEKLMDSPSQFDRDEAGRIANRILDEPDIIPGAPSSPQPTKTITKTIYSPVLLTSGSYLRPGDRVMKVQYTSDNLSGMLGDKGTVYSVDPLTNIVAVQLDRYYPQRLLSYIPSYALEIIYDPIPYPLPPRVSRYIDDDDDDFEDERPRRSSRKSSRKSSKKSKKSKSKSRR
jgi:hypothetical protein